MYINPLNFERHVRKYRLSLVLENVKEEKQEKKKKQEININLC